MSEEINHDRRRLLATAVLTIAAAGARHDRPRGRATQQDQTDQAGDEHVVQAR